MLETEPFTDTTTQPSAPEIWDTSKFCRETQRQISIITNAFGPRWRDRFPGRSISSLHQAAINDEREVIFARVAPDTKAKLIELANAWETTLAYVVEALIDDEYEAEPEAEPEDE